MIEKIPEFKDGNNELFELLKADVKKTIKGHRLSEDNVAFVALNNDYWVPLQEFYLLKRFPRVWDHFGTEQFGSWLLPKGFQIVMNDYSILKYHHSWGDPYYSTWVLVPSTRRPKKHYIENRAPSNRTFGDFVTNAKVVRKSSEETKK
jgi:hypothetical protein